MNDDKIVRVKASGDNVYYRKAPNDLELVKEVFQHLYGTSSIEVQLIDQLPIEEETSGEFRDKVSEIERTGNSNFLQTEATRLQAVQKRFTAYLSSTKQHN